MFRNWLKSDRSKGSDTVNVSVVIIKTMQIYPNGSRWFSYQYTIPDLKVKSVIYNMEMENAHTVNDALIKCMEFIRTIIPHPINVNITKLSVIEIVENE